MGFLNFAASSQFLSYTDAPVAHAKLFIYASGTDGLAPVFRDRNLTFMMANPVIADAAGTFCDFYLEDGTYRIVVLDRRGRQILTEDGVTSRPALSIGTQC